MIQREVQRHACAQRNPHEVTSPDLECVEQYLEVRGVAEGDVAEGDRGSKAAKVVSDRVPAGREIAPDEIPKRPIAREPMQHHQRRSAAACAFDHQGCAGDRDFQV